jgi:hypothetical protein
VAQQSSDALLRRFDAQPEPPTARLAKKLADQATAKAKLVEQLRADRSAGEKLLAPIDKPEYVMTPSESIRLQVGTTEKEVRTWANRVRGRLDSSGDLLELFDGGPDLRHSPMSFLPIALSQPHSSRVSRKEIVSFLKRKLRNLDEVIKELDDWTRQTAA